MGAWSGHLPLKAAVLLVATMTYSSAGASSASNALKPELHMGCLYSKNLTNKMRVCNSEDPASAASVYCRIPTISYAEVRIAPGNWDSANIITWLIQILLSELLDVPTSIEMWEPSFILPPISLYQPQKSLNYSNYNSDNFDHFQNAFDFKGECSMADRSSVENYQPCAHVVPESWGNMDPRIDLEAVYQGLIEPPQSLELLGQNRWHIPLYTAERDPSLLSYHGLMGKKNRKKLAERFLRPTTWKEYCDQVSHNGCSTPDDVAFRPPQDELEDDRMFVEGLYIGHFRATDKNNCTANPDNCTGFFLNYPCEWSSAVPFQLHHLNISLDVDLDMRPGGYTLQQMPEIWRAANATKSDVIMYWWSPDILYSEFLNTDAEFTAINLPRPTLATLQARAGQTYDHCSLGLEQIVAAPPEAATEDPPNFLSKVLSSTVFDSYNNPAITAGMKAPSHAALSNFRFSSLQLDRILLMSLASNSGDMREAVCNFVADNVAYLRDLIPPTYPRSLEPNSYASLVYASTILGAVVVSLVLYTFYMVYKHRNRRTILYAQIDFLMMLLFGSLLIGVGAILIGAPASSATCITETWLINIGFTLQLVPLLVKVAAVNQIMAAGKKMRRVQIARPYLFGVVASICALVAVYLIIWTALDPPMVMPEYELTDETNEQGETIVWVFEVCGSQSVVWSYISVGWNVLLLVCTSTLAFQMRKVKLKGLRETNTLAILVYAHSLLIILGLITYILSSVFQEYVLAKCRSFLFSIDAFATLVIYFLPKLTGKDIEVGRSTVRVSTGASSQLTSSWIANEPPSLQLLNTDRHSGEIEASGKKDESSCIQMKPGLSSIKEDTLEGHSKFEDQRQIDILDNPAV